jgi:hypothetical protein
MSVAFKAAWMLLKRRGHNLDFTAPEIAHSLSMPPRRGTQEEADEMEAMGVPEMGRTLGGTPPPNIGRAGSTNAFEPSSQEYLSDIEQQLLK